MSVAVRLRLLLRGGALLFECGAAYPTLFAHAVAFNQLAYVQGLLIESYGMCGVGILEGDLLASCTAHTLSIQDVFEAAMHNHPTVAFANLNSKADTTQMSFYAAIAATEPVDPGCPYVLTENEYENEVPCDQTLALLHIYVFFFSWAVGAATTLSHAALL